jgi:hypothetical protein
MEYRPRQPHRGMRKASSSGPSFQTAAAGRDKEEAERELSRWEERPK